MFEPPWQAYVCPEHGLLQWGQYNRCRVCGETAEPVEVVLVAALEASETRVRELKEALEKACLQIHEYRAAIERFLASWDEFDGPPLTVEETHAAVAESVEEIRAALSSPSGVGGQE